MNITIRKAKVEDAHAIVTAEQEIAKTPGYFCSQPSELSEQNVVRTIRMLSDSGKGIYLIAEREGKRVGRDSFRMRRTCCVGHVGKRKKSHVKKLSLPLYMA